MIINQLKNMKKKYQEAGKKKYKNEIEIMNKAIKEINKLEKEIIYLEKQRQESFFKDIDRL